MKVLTKLKKYGIAVATFVFCCCMTLLFAIGVGYTVRAEETAAQETEHSCCYFTYPGNNGEGGTALAIGGVNNQIWSELMKELATLDDSSLGSGLFTGYMYLTEDITWEETVYIPRNVHVAICLNGYEIDCDFQYSFLGACGVYFYDCNEMHGCTEVIEGQTIEIPFINQALVDFMPYWAMAGGSLPAMENLYVALGEDVSFDKNWNGALRGGDNLYICMNGYEVSNVERLTINGGSVTLLECQPSTPCNYLVGDEGEDSHAIELGTLVPNDFADLVDFVNGYEEEITAPYAVHATLKGNVSLTETLVIPENVYFGVCLNGYYLNVTVQEPTNGGLYTFDCGATHTCASIHETVPYLNQDLIDFLPMWMYCGGSVMDALDTTSYALAIDVSFNSNWTGYGQGSTLVFCTGGYTLSNQEVLAAEVIMVDCGKDEICRICHPISGIKSIPLREVDLTQEGVYVEETLQSGSETKTITKKAIDCFTPYVDENGVFVGDGLGETKYFFSLQSDIKLAKTLVIPDGFDVHICLNGYQIESPTIIFYKEKDDVVGVFTIEYGGSLAIYDCSPTQSGSIYTNIDDSYAETQEGLDFSGLGIIFAYSIVNSGSLTMNGGSLAAMIGIINAGDLAINGGEVGGALMGIVQGDEFNVEGVEHADATPTIDINGGAVSSAIAGVIAQAGTVTMDGGTIKTVGTAIGMGVDINGDLIENSDATLIINDGAIEYGESVADVFVRLGFLKDLDISLEELQEEGVNVTDMVSIIVNGSIEMNGDLDITYSDLMLELQEKNAAAETERLQAEADQLLGEGEESVPVDPVVYDCIDIMLVNGTVIDADEDATFENQYVVMAEDGSIITYQPMSHVFVGASGMATIYTSDGELVIVDEDGDLTFLAQAVGVTASTSGLIMLNFYVELNQVFIDNVGSRVIIKTKTSSREYTVSEGKKSGSYYVFSVGINAKDYKEQAICEFSMPVATEGGTKTITWHGKTYSIVEYLDYILNDTSGRYDTAKNLAATMKNFCMSASVHFGTAKEYEYSNGIENYLAQVNAEILEGFKTELFDNSDNVTLRGATLFFEYATTIRIYFTLDTAVDINSLSYTVNGSPVNVHYYGDNYYYLEIENIAASGLGTTYEINIDGTILRYSAMSYAYATVANARGGSETAVTAVKMLYLYYMAALEYKGA